MTEIITALTGLLEMVNTLSPLAGLILLIGVLYVQIWKQPTREQVHTIATNHLHDIPYIAANISSMAESLGRIEKEQATAHKEIVLRLQDLKDDNK